MYTKKQIKDWLLSSVGLNPISCGFSNEELLNFALELSKEYGYSGVGTISFSTNECVIMLVK